MVYESDFYTTRRPYTRPISSHYTITNPGGIIRPITPIQQTQALNHLPHTIPYIGHKRLVHVIHTPYPVIHYTRQVPVPIRIYSRVRPSVIAAELQRIRDLPRPSSVSYVSRYLNSRDNILFDDEAREIRARADSLLRKIHVFVPRPLSSDFAEVIVPERMRSNDYIRRLLQGRNSAKKEDESPNWYDSPAHREFGTGHLAAVSYTGGKPHSRRRPYYKVADLRAADVQSDVNLLSYYAKNRQAAASAYPDPPLTERELRKARALAEDFIASAAPRRASPDPEPVYKPDLATVYEPQEVKAPEPVVEKQPEPVVEKEPEEIQAEKPEIVKEKKVRTTRRKSAKADKIVEPEPAPVEEVPIISEPEPVQDEIAVAEAEPEPVQEELAVVESESEPVREELEPEQQVLTESQPEQQVLTESEPEQQALVETEPEPQVLKEPEPETEVEVEEILSEPRAQIPEAFPEDPEVEPELMEQQLEKPVIIESESPQVQEESEIPESQQEVPEQIQMPEPKEGEVLAELEGEVAVEGEQLPDLETEPAPAEEVEEVEVDDYWGSGEDKQETDDEVLQRKLDEEELRRQVEELKRLAEERWKAEIEERERLEREARAARLREIEEQEKAEAERIAEEERLEAERTRDARIAEEQRLAAELEEIIAKEEEERYAIEKASEEARKRQDIEEKLAEIVLSTPDDFGAPRSTSEECRCHDNTKSQDHEERPDSPDADEDTHVEEEANCLSTDHDDLSDCHPYDGEHEGFNSVPVLEVPIDHTPKIEEITDDEDA
ncbi:titin isoform X3 [Diachasma alloeum]|uniref:titin isoform X3 n=1 Tax=Diachasma alloeum TaxID=454923 RepID=UPI000738370C|nr:titin isoform X3 [Diachasma alloeum]